MVVRHFDIMSIAFIPAETDAPLVVDTDAVLAAAIARKRLQPICWRDAEIIQTFSDIKLNQLAPRDPVQLRRKMAQELALKQPLSASVPKRLNHEMNNNAWRYDCQIGAGHGQRPTRAAEAQRKQSPIPNT
jgi:hypothetical protein